MKTQAGAEKEINTMADLEERIRELELLEAEQMNHLKASASIAAESIRPSNIIKNAFSDITGSGNFKKEALKASAGIAAGMLIKKVLTNNSASLLKKIAAYGLQFLTAKVVANKFPKIKKTIPGQ